MRITLRRLAFVLIVNVAIVLGFLFAADLYLERNGFRRYVRTYPGTNSPAGNVAWARSELLLGWTIDPAYLPGQVNPQGFRDAKDIERWPKDRSRARVMMLGDSFVVGAHLDPDRTLPALLEQRLGPSTDVFSVAVPGWGVDQMYLAYERYKGNIEPAVVVLAFIDDDVRRVLEAYRVAERLTKPTVRVVDGRLVRQDSVSPVSRPVARLLEKSTLLSLMLREFYLATEAKQIVTAIFGTIAHDLSQRGGTLVVIRIPTRDDAEQVNRLRRRLGDWGSALTAPNSIYLDVGARDPQRWRPEMYVQDGHLNGVGTEMLADELATAVRAKTRLN